MLDKLAKIQLELNAPKGQRNTFGNYNYRSCEDILNAVKPLLNGLVLTVTDEMVVHGDRFYIKATATIQDGEKSWSTSGWAREALNKKGMDESQITGAASSYARKYALNGLFCIDDAKDSDTNEHKNQVDNTPNWYNGFAKNRASMIQKIQSGEHSPKTIIESLKKSGYAISNKVNDQIMGLG